MKDTKIFVLILTLLATGSMFAQPAPRKATRDAQTHGMPPPAAWDHAHGSPADRPVEVPSQQVVKKDPVGDRVSASPPAKIRLMMLGNSITAATCYQPFLWEHILKDSVDKYVEFVGTHLTNHYQGVTCAGKPYYLPTEGHSGWNSKGIADSVGIWAVYDHPDVTVMHVGTNNFWNGTSPALITATLKDYDRIVDSVRKTNPAVKILVAQIIPMNYNAATLEGTNMLDDSIPSWAASRNTVSSPVAVVDLRTGWDLAHWYVDNVHPNELGSHFMADKVYAALTGLKWLGGVTPVDDSRGREVPAAFSLRQNYPNPFNPSTSITYALPKESHVDLKVFDVLGRKVAALVNESKGAGEYTVQWDARNVPGGVYFYRLVAGRFSDTKRLVLIK